MIKFAFRYAQAIFYVPQTFPERKLSKAHDQKLLPAGKAFNTEITVMGLYTTIKIISVNNLEELRKKIFT